MSKQQSLLAFVNFSPPSPKVSRIDEGVDGDAILPAVSTSSGSESEDSETGSQQQSSAPVDMEAQLEETSATATSSESNQELQPTSTEIEIRSHPYQPRSHVFPKKRFGQAKPEYRSFKASWFDHRNWSNWLHWEAANERAYCIICRNVYALGQLTMSRNRETAFITTGFANWKDATRSFEQHRKSLCHKEALMKWSHHVQGMSVNTHLQQQLTDEREKARCCLEKLFTSIEYLARQALPLRGHTESSGNFFQLLQLRADDSPELKSWLSQRRAYTSHEVQNEMLQILSCQLQRSILNDVHSSLWYSISADETVDASLCEQV